MLLIKTPTSIDEQASAKTLVLTARKFLSEDTVLQRTDFEIREIPLEYLPEGTADFNIDGKILSHSLEKGEILFTKDLRGGKSEPKVMLTMQTDALGISQGDKVAVMVTKDNNTLTLLDNLQVEQLAEDNYSDNRLVVVAAKENEAQAINLLKPKADLVVIPSTGGLRAVEDPLLAAQNLLQEKTTKSRKVEVIEGGEVTWYDID
ncbi:MAG: SAF domain-containing protein [Firmicutes bacterium]|nr:SAF domain-containing protein [Bacillota bacterium]MDD4264080.1 SAF domain-containing protein [Bacillota bacterium]MDD4694176.1 SAF domain-containing protein [Bacillota bacterium]